MRLLKQLVPVTLVAMIGGQGAAAAEGSPLLVLVIGLATAVLSVVVYAWAVRWSEHRAAEEVAAKGAAARTGLGTLIGAGWCAAVIANIAFLGGYRVDGLGSVEGAAGLFGFMAAAAVTEELMFRGILFRLTEEFAGTWIALTLTGVLFGLFHLGNPNAGLWGVISVAISAGLMLAAAYAATRNLWVPIGIHFGWNFALGGVFGAEVSGNGANEGLLNGVVSGSALINGGRFGPEGSPYTVLFGVLLTIVFLWLAHRRGTMVPRRRSGDRARATAALSQ